MVCRLVQQQDVRLGKEEPADGHATALAAGEVLHLGVAGRASKGVHGALDGAVNLPRVGRVELRLELIHPRHESIHVAVGLSHLHRDLVVFVDIRLDRGDAHLDVLHDRLAVVEGGS